MKRLIILLSFVLGLSGFAAAQDYSTGIGLRGGPFVGLSVKHFVSTKGAVEGILASRWRGFEITGLYEVHNPFPDVDRLKWYYGAGGHIGFYNGDNIRWHDEEGAYTVLGVDLILGLEYSFSEVPISLSLDWKPAFNIIGSRFVADGVALSIRYIF